MGGTNSVAHVQATVQAMFADIYNNRLLIWIDDLLRKVLTIYVKRGLKLNPRKCSFLLREVKWCGRVVSGQGVKHDPERIAGLISLPSPTSGQQLQQFVCALNWVRMSIPAYNKLVGLLSSFT
ncbi:hypothetical protein PHMEG_00029910 [Phytophthora megakarya]|uniref:Reverse transcriptase n=1 Tax=Phytophthora megakarya TaxID=4795 RepID=A0A225V330_9STRA|nr:hypothetical protein PHMEG_00029910 [Phytophthora megakarya]